MNIALQLMLPPADVADLVRLKGLTEQRVGRWQSGAVTIVWHDTATGELRCGNRVLVEQKKAGSPRGRLTEAVWRLETLQPDPQIYPPGGLPPVLAEPTQPHDVFERPEKLVAIAAFSGKWRSLELRTNETPGEAVCVTVVDGELRSLAAAEPVCRLTLQGAPDAVLSIAKYLCVHLQISVPTQSLAVQGQLLNGTATASSAPNIPGLPGGGSSEDGFVRLLGGLAASLLFWAPHVARQPDPDGKRELVHQMRVAVRRLRSALLLFKAIVGCPEIEAIKEGLKQLGAFLGPARDWDVFLMNTGRAVSCAFPNDAAVAGLMRASEVRRDGHYLALRHYLQRVEFRRLCVLLAWAAQARPWRRHSASISETINPGLDEFAAQILGKRRRRLLAAGPNISDLPDTDLHAVRLRAKQLRYACEFFLPLFSGKSIKRFIRDLAELQDELGLVNDSAVATRLLEELRGSGRERSRAQGIVIGYVAGGSTRERRRIAAIWKKIQRRKDFTK